MAANSRRSTMKIEGPTIESMWQSVTLRFQENTGTELDLKPRITLEECIGIIEKVGASVDPATTSQNKSGRERAKRYGIDMLHCLKLLGGVASQALGMVFAPSSLCFNALSLLLDVPANLHKFHSAVDGLFEVLGPALSTFKIYDTIQQFDEIEETLRIAIHELMISFVDICSLSIKLRLSGKWEKFKCGAKLILLDKDSGVQAEIERFKTLTAAHHSIQATQTLKTVLETNSTVARFLDTLADTFAETNQMLKQTEDHRKSEEIRGRRLLNIRSKLGMDDDSVMKASKALADELWRTSVDGTASWCERGDKRVPAFHHWADRNATNANSLFLLTGDSNTGKSVTMSWIAHRLRATYQSRISPEAPSAGEEASARQSPRTLVASYFFPTNTMKNETEKSETDRPTIETALKCMAVQFANADGAYAKRMSIELDAKDDPRKFAKGASCQELWDLLGLGSSAGTTVYYLVIDGLPDGQQEKCLGLLRSLNPASCPSSVRVILSTKRDMWEKIRSTFPSFHDVDVVEYSANDICTYVDRELKNDDVLQEQDADSEELRRRIRTSLSNGVKGNYFKVESALQKIKTALKASEGLNTINAILEKANKDEKQISQAMIDTLQEELSAREIDELNEILVWVIFGHEWFSIEQLNAARFLRFNEPSYQSLKAKLAGRGRYATIFNPQSISSSAVNIADGIEDLLTKDRKDSRLQQVDSSTRFSVTIKIEKAEFRTVQSFVWSFMQKLTQEQFDFEKLEDQARSKSTIQVNRIDSHFAIVQRTFALLAAKPDVRTQALAPYLLNYLPQHLEKLEQATGLDVLSNAQKREIVNGLFSLFDSGKVIEKHWASCNELTWHKTRGELDIFLGWLKNPVLVEHRSTLDLEWLDRVNHDSNPCGALLRPVMSAVARQWLEESVWAVQQPFEWLHDFIAMMDDIDDSGLPTESRNVEAVADWCNKRLDMKKSKGGIWDERLAETLHAVGQYAEAIEMFNAALRGNSNPKLLKGLAESLAGEERYLEACQKMQEVLDDPKYKDCSDKATLCSDYMRVAEWYGKLKQPEPLIDCLKKAIVLDPEFHEGRYKLLQTFLDLNDTKASADLLLGVANDRVAHGKSGKLSRMIDYMVQRMDKYGKTFGSFFSIVFLSDQCAQLCEPTIREMNHAISRAKEHDNLSDLSTLLLFKGVALHHYPNIQELSGSSSPTESAVDLWSQCVRHDAECSSGKNASILISAHHFEEALKFPDEVKHIQELKSIVMKESCHGLSTTRAYLACYYALVNQISSAREAVQVAVEEAFEMLSDDTDENDWWGYYDLGVILMHCGDMLNALSAFSLCLPLPDKAKIIAWLLEFEQDPEQSLGKSLCASLLQDPIPDDLNFNRLVNEVEKLLDGLANSNAQDTSTSNKGFEEIRARLDQFPQDKEIAPSDGYLRCDGGCGRIWDFDTVLNHCKFCYNTAFCDACLQILKNGEMNKHWGSIHALRCNKTHQWLRLESWDRAGYLENLRGNVLVGGKLEEGKRVGGEHVLISKWLDGLKHEWGYTN